jgi:plastocyanin
MSRKFIIALVLFLIGSTTAGVYLFFSQKKKDISNISLPTPPPRLETVGREIKLPTKTPEEIKKIAEIKDYYVEIKSMAFYPSEVRVKTGDQVFWINKDSVPHVVRGDNWGGVEIKPEEKFIQSFDKPGVYKYYCQLHPQMKGVVIVE